MKQLQLNKEYREIFELSQFAFQYKLTEDEIEKKRLEAERHIIWGVKEEGRLAAKLHVIPLTVYVHGKQMHMGGVSSVATWPEFRRNGLVKELLTNALNDMRKNGQVLSYLHPFSVPFYRKFGYELAFNEKIYTIPFEKLKRNWDAKGYVRRREPDVSLLNNVYNSYAKRYTGAIARDEKWWKQRVLKDDAHLAVAYDESGIPVGYIHFEVKDKKFTVIEMAYSSLTGLKLLMQFISNHDSMAETVELVVPENDNIPLLLDEPRFETKVDPYFMARVVNVKEFLKQFPFEGSATDESISLYVEDLIIPENSGLYNIRQSSGGVTQIKSRSQAEVTCTIQQFTAMFLGYKRPTELYQLGLITGKEDAIKKLEQIIPHQQTYFPDYF
ncbi:GNAT family N-acetyltransferase [Ornithinibacillus californiensis]|uniref:GNAT family N-acetyltransferase n=1 Tax=Ornithinibacillus californiensis TaxID=161536 RepID=UPI0012EDBF64|nr:GNAT family N-acetyltransferase [Ornithinibacillus californiensis]